MNQLNKDLTLIAFRTAIEAIDEVAADHDLKPSDLMYTGYLFEPLSSDERARLKVPGQPDWDWTLTLVFHYQARRQVSAIEMICGYTLGTVSPHEAVLKLVRLNQAQMQGEA